MRVRGVGSLAVFRAYADRLGMVEIATGPPSKAAIARPHQWSVPLNPCRLRNTAPQFAILHNHGRVNGVDYGMLCAYLCGSTPRLDDPSEADMNGDGLVRGDDAVLLRHAAPAGG